MIRPVAVRPYRDAAIGQEDMVRMNDVQTLLTGRIIAVG